MLSSRQARVGMGDSDAIPIPFGNRRGRLGSDLGSAASSWKQSALRGLRATNPLQLILVFAVYVAAAKGGLALASNNESVSAVWPPTGIALAAVLLLGFRIWPAIAVGAFVANVTTAGPALSALGIATGNTLEAVVGAFLLLRVADFHRSLDRMRDVLSFVLFGAVLATAISATIGVASLWVGGTIPSGELGLDWRVWWLGDATGALLVTPLILVLAARPQLPKDRTVLIEAAATTAFLIGISLLVFNTADVLVWSIFPLLLWSAFRFRQPGAVISSVIVASIGVWFTARDLGPFGGEVHDTALLTEQAFVAVAAVTALLAAVLGTDHRRLQTTLRRLRQSEVSLAEAQQVARFGSWEWDVPTNKVTWSDELYRIYGLRPRQFDATFEGYLERVHEGDRTRVMDLIQNALKTGGSFSFEERVVRPSGEVKRLLSRGRAITDESGEVVSMLGVCQDVTEAREAERQLRHLADHDALTGLINRRCLIQELDEEVARSRREGGNSATLLIDLDHLQFVNDTMGHEVGDHVLVRVAELLQERKRRGDLIARLGGDEFAIFLPDAGEREATSTAHKLLTAIREHAVVASPERTMRITASIGIALLEGAGARSGEELLAAADIAMFRAKEKGRDRVQLRLPADDAQLRSRLSWAERIRDALARDLFVLHAQPILDLRTGKIARHELLIRMRAGDELVPPGEFLHIAEEFGLIQAIDQWVIGKAIELIDVRAAAGEHLTLEVNLSGPSVTDDEVLEYIEEELVASGIDPASLIFEVTETAAIPSMDKARDFALRVGELGCAFALDDFGTGFGSFYYLKHLPFDYLKIDGDFVRELSTNATDQLTVRAIAEIAKGMGKRTIAEFVQDDASLELLQEYGVDFAQGFHVGKPRPVEECWPQVPAPAA